MTPALSASRPLPNLLPIAEHLWQELNAFGRLANAFDWEQPLAKHESLEGYLARGYVTAETILATLEDEAGLHLTERAPFRQVGSEWAPGKPLAGYTGDDGGPTPVEAAKSMLANWQLDLIPDKAARGQRVLRSMLWIASQDSITAACQYGFELIESGRAFEPKSVAAGVTALLGARSYTGSDEQAVARIRNGRDSDAPEEWLELQPAVDWFDPTQLSQEMKELESDLVEKVLTAIEHTRASESLDQYLLDFCTATKLVETLLFIVRWTNKSLSLPMRALISQLEEIDSDHFAVLTGFQLGSFPQVVEYANQIKRSYQALEDKDWQSRFWSERLLLPFARQADLDGERTPDDWLMPSFRIAQPWTVWHTLEDDALCQRNRFLVSSSGPRRERLSLDDRSAAIQKGLQNAEHACTSGDGAGARLLLENLVREYPWAEPAWFRLEEISCAEGRTEEALRHLTAVLVLRPYEKVPWEELGLLLIAIDALDEAQICAAVAARLPDRARPPS